LAKSANYFAKQAMCNFADWMANDFLPWVAYRPFEAGQLAALDKCPGIHDPILG
jgi:hypothetical protein